MGSSRNIINKSEKVKEIKNKDNATSIDKKILTDEEKKLRTLRKELQEKLIKFCTRIPIFMYLTDEREQTLKDVIEQIDSRLFTRVTGIDIKTFNLLCEHGVFNSELMNDAIYKFKRYEDASLEYTGLNKHEKENKIGGFDIQITRREFYEKKFDEDEANSEQRKDIGIFQKFMNIFRGKKE